jgi:hypothetical protein
VLRRKPYNTMVDWGLKAPVCTLGAAIRSPTNPESLAGTCGRSPVRQSSGARRLGAPHALQEEAGRKVEKVLKKIEERESGRWAGLTRRRTVTRQAIMR